MLATVLLIGGVVESTRASVDGGSVYRKWNPPPRYAAEPGEVLFE